MRPISRSSLPILLVLPLILLFSTDARAQGTCASECSPFADCDYACTVCFGWTPDGGCISENWTTCGNASSACMNCTPNWIETSRELRGTYGNGSAFSCSHHKVEWVTREDLNKCNKNSAYWTVSTCEDTIDGGKSGWFPDCCNGYGPNGVLDSTYTCNHQHSC